MFLRSVLLTVFVAATSLLPAAPATAADQVTVNGQSHVLTGTNIARGTNALVLYTPAKGASTGTNKYGAEAAVVDGKVTALQAYGPGNMAIPANGYVLSGHGTSKTWLARLHNRTAIAGESH